MIRTRTTPVAICVLAFLFLTQPGFGAHHYPDYPVKPANEYEIKVVKSNVVVGADPLENPDQQKVYFNTNLGSRGILPVLLVIQNTSSSDSYLFDLTAVGLGEQVEMTGKNTRKTASELGSGGLLDLSLLTDASDVRENMLKKEARSRTLSPGSSTNGFVYIPVPTGSPRQKIHLQVPLTNAQSGETEVINLVF